MTGLLGLPRVPLLIAHTPLHPAPRLGAELGVELWFKRDDLTGLGMGGNKVRGLEYLIADALTAGCDCLVTGAGPQSNWALLAGLAARRHGLDPYLVCYGDPAPPSGNLLLDSVAGIDVRFTGDPARTSADAGMDALAAELRAAGRRPYVVPRGGATVLGSVGYLRASLELADQLLSVGVTPRSLWLATGSCGTQAGLLAGARWLATPYRVVGVTTSRPADEAAGRVADLAADVAGLLDLPCRGRRGADDVLVRDGWLGPGYGLPSAEGDAATALVARTEGVFLDPVFGAKAMAALIAEARAGNVTGPVVFLVTGGAPTLFAAPKEPV